MRELSAENYPPQCTLCRGELIIGTFERQLDGAQHARVRGQILGPAAACQQRERSTYEAL